MMEKKYFKSYQELTRFKTLQERYEYLRFGAEVGAATFGFDRYLNQAFYRSKQWREVRTKVILRDEGCDLGVVGYPCIYRGVVHHINPITLEQVEEGDPIIFDMNNLVLCTEDTHRAIHYGPKRQLDPVVLERRPNDQCPWL